MEESLGQPDTPRRTIPANINLLYKLPFVRAPTEQLQPNNMREESGNIEGSMESSQGFKTRRRRGSLRKVALLGKDAQRPRRDNSLLGISKQTQSSVNDSDIGSATLGIQQSGNGLGLEMGGSFRASNAGSGVLQSATAERSQESVTQDTSTTDDDDVLQIASTTAPRPATSASSGSESYFSSRATQHKKSFHQAKSPLSYSGLASTSMPPPEADWDYAETEWWGWVVLSVTWFVFVIGMGSCLDIWSWAWDVGKTPYAPPELEDDETLPIVGYYPALIILTCVMAWVWVVVAWVGMKYFRHAKISGD